MQPTNAHRKETFLFLGGGFLFFVFLFGGIILLRTGIIGPALPTVTPTKDVNQVIGEMHATITSKALATVQFNALLTSTSIALTASAPTSTHTPYPTTEPSSGATRLMPADGMTEVYIPSGSFLMGAVDSLETAEAQEKPQHTVYLNGFWMDQTEVTQGMYKLCISAGKCPDISQEQDPIANFSTVENDNHPVVNITWDQARNYCEQAGRRLPTEAEWEKAARGTDGRTYPWGETYVDGNLALYGKAFNGTRPVDGYKSGASPYGLLDMIGNASEWVLDSYSETYYSVSSAQNPTGPENDDPKVFRGSSWKDDVSLIRISRRSFANRDSKENDRGFRCASAN